MAGHGDEWRPNTDTPIGVCPEWSMTMKCGLCDRVGTYRLVDLANFYGRHRTVAEIVARLRCQTCHRPSVGVQLVYTDTDGSSKAVRVSGSPDHVGVNPHARPLVDGGCGGLCAECGRAGGHLRCPHRHNRASNPTVKSSSAATATARRPIMGNGEASYYNHQRQPRRHVAKAVAIYYMRIANGRRIVSSFFVFIFVFFHSCKKDETEPCTVQAQHCPQQAQHCPQV